MLINRTMQRVLGQTFEPSASLAAIGPDGSVMTVHDLPPPDTRRWVAQRKAQVVFGVQAGLITLKDACARYGLTPEEFASWQTMIKKHGIRGLRVTRLTQYRKSDKARLYENSEA
jgi:transcriptional regulator of nitric oxide reductase